MPFDAVSYALGKRALLRAIKAEALPKLSGLEIDVDKNWAGRNITNLGAGAHDVNAKLNEIANKVSKTGDTMTGALTISTTRPQLLLTGAGTDLELKMDVSVGYRSRIDFYEDGFHKGRVYWKSPNYFLLGDLHLAPSTDNYLNLGTSILRWANVYAVKTTIGDLVLEGKDAKWKITEKSDGIYAEDLKTGKKYRLKMEEVE